MLAARHLLIGLSCFFIAGCLSSEHDLQVSLKAPVPREARVKLSAALDVSDIETKDFARRIVIDEIIVNIAALRLLGESPAIPLSGQALIEDDFVLSTSSDAQPGNFPFPASMLDDHLAVYARIDKSTTLDSSSVIVKARLFDSPTLGFQQRLISGENTSDSGQQTSPNPDGEPNREESPNPDGEPNREESPNPDGEPNLDESPNPDGEPNDDDPEQEGSRQSGLRLAGDSHELQSKSRRALSFELRGQDQVEMVVIFDAASRMNVTLSIPARRWITTTALAQLESALQSELSNEQTQERSSKDGVEPFVLDLANRPGSFDGDSSASKPKVKDYRLVSDESKDPKKLRSR